MKKYLTFRTTYMTLLLCSIGLMFSCSKEDGPAQELEEVETQLVLTSSESDLSTDQQVTFEVAADGEKIDADIYINNEKISGLTHTFEAAGSYQVLAKKEGYIDSEAITVKAYQIDVYVSGISTRSEAMYWKNGEPVMLGSRPHSSYGFSVFVDGADVYVAGYDNDGIGTLAVYWKNGTRVTLNDPSVSQAIARGITVDNGDVFVAGEDETSVKYWKNGQAVQLNNDGGRGNAIAVKDGAVHVVGETFERKKRVTLWQGGVEYELSNGEDDQGLANGVTLSNGSVYVSGFEYPVHGSVAGGFSKYWKDGVSVTLGRGEIATGIAVEGDDVYVSANDYNNNGNRAKYWKNDTPVPLTDLSTSATTRGIAVDNGDVYVAGSELTSKGRRARYWKNDTMVELEGGEEAFSVFVVRSYGTD